MIKSKNAEKKQNKEIVEVAAERLAEIFISQMEAEKKTKKRENNEYFKKKS